MSRWRPMLTASTTVTTPSSAILGGEEVCVFGCLFVCARATSLLSQGAGADTPRTHPTPTPTPTPPTPPPLRHPAPLRQRLVHVERADDGPRVGQAWGRARGRTPGQRGAVPRVGASAARWTPDLRKAPARPAPPRPHQQSIDRTGVTPCHATHRNPRPFTSGAGRHRPLTRGLDDDVVKVGAPLPQLVEGRHQIITHGAAQAAVGQHSQRIAGALEHL